MATGPGFTPTSGIMDKGQGEIVVKIKALFRNACQELEITAAQFAGPGIGFINPTETVISVLLHAILARYQSQYDFRLYLQNKIL